jgi:hypothetical protein
MDPEGCRVTNASGIGSGRSITAWITLNTAALAPIPKANVITARCEDGALSELSENVAKVVEYYSHACSLASAGLALKLR